MHIVLALVHDVTALASDCELQMLFFCSSIDNSTLSCGSVPSLKRMVLKKAVLSFEKLVLI